MSLRAKVLTLFAAFAIVPLLAIGVVDYVRSARAVDALIQAQTGQIAERIGADLRDRYEVVQANLALIADNAETERLLHGGVTQDAIAAGREAEAYLRQIWSSVGDDFDWLTIADSTGREVYRLGDADRGTELGRLVITRRSSRATGAVGTVTAAVRLARLLPSDALASRFGREGYNVIVDRETGRFIFGPEHADAVSAALRLAGDSTRIAFNEGDKKRSATVVRLPSPPWSVLSAAAVDEFAGPFAAIRSANLFLVVLMTLCACLAFFLLLWRATRSLGILTRAADAVGRGNLQPPLPRTSRDEVGRLSAAFGLMTTRVRETMTEIERSRQMAAVGEFASQISHEIRNPLTSIKLNLQKLERAKRAGRLPPETDKPLEITLREIDRMDRVVHGVLQLGRSRATTHGRINVGRVVKETIDLASLQLERNGVTVRAESANGGRGGDVWVRGDAALLSGALLNLILNAAEAAAGGEVFVDVEQVGSAGRVTVRDTGPGIPREHRDRIFEPFFTTKNGGTGLGLALAQRTVEEHGGSLRLAEPTAGAAFVVELPIDNSPEGVS